MNVGDFTDRDEIPAYVQFERRAVENKLSSLENGRSTSVDADFALVTPAYSKDMIEQKVETFFANTRRDVKTGRTPKKMLHIWEEAYEAFKNGQEAPLHGMPIREWSAISPAQIKNLIAINILTVESLAQCNDEGLRRIGMGGQELRRKAENWLKAAQDHGPLTLKLTELETRCDRLQATNDALTDANRSLLAQIETFKRPFQPQEMVTESITIDDLIPDEESPDAFEMAPAPQVVEKSLSEQYVEKFGKKPHHMMKDETIRKKLEE